MFDTLTGIRPRAQDTVIDYDREFVQEYFTMPDEELDVTRMSPWLLRIELNREMMVRTGACRVWQHEKRTIRCVG